VKTRAIEKRLAEDSRKSAPWRTDDPRLAAYVEQGGGTPALDGRRWEHAAGVPWAALPVMACLGWLKDNFCTADLLCYDQSVDRKKADTPVWDCPLRDVIDATEDMTPSELFGLFITSHKCWGETYFLKVRTSIGGAVTRLIWIPPETPLTPRWNLKPVGDDTRRIAGFRYTVDGRPLDDLIKPENVVYIRDMIDPLDPARGLSRLRSGMRAIVGHTRADSLAATVLGNQTTAKAFIPDASYMLDEGQAEGVRSYYDQSIAMTGRLPVMAVSGRFEDLGRTPGDMGLDFLPDRMEANICALMGPNAMTVGLASGATMRSYANQSESDRQSWHNGLIPLQEALAGAFTRDLLPDIDPTLRRYAGWDRSRVDALKDDKTAAVTRAVAMYEGDIATLDESRAEAGLEPIGDEAGAMRKSEAAAEVAEELAEPMDPESETAPNAPPEDDAEDEDGGDNADV
jgi:phage portal protein BeeE